MSNGYLVAANADLDAARDIAGGFGLDVISAGSIGDAEATAAALASAANVGLIVSHAATRDAAYIALLQVIAARVLRAQLIVVEADARELFAFLPTLWPAMSLKEARARSGGLARQQQEPQPEPPVVAAPLPEPEPAPQAPEEQPAQDLDSDIRTENETAQEEAPPPLRERREADDGVARESEDTHTGGYGAGAAAREPEPTPEAAAPAPPPADELPTPPPQSAAPSPAPSAPEPAAPPAAEPPAPPPKAAAPEPQSRDDYSRSIDMHSSTARSAPSTRLGETAPADATAFAPKKLRRATPELVRIVIHQPKDLQAVIKAARKLDPRTEPAPQGMRVGDIPLGSSVGVALEVRGAACDGAVQRRVWNGEPIDFSFIAEADAGVKQAVFLARVFVDDAQIGVLAFTRNITGPAKKPASDGDRVRLKRHKRVFLSYSSKDREVVSAIATAYASAGIEHFWDRASLKSGEEWSPRLKREIDRADLFHLCWSKNASSSEWVQKEAEHAMTRRKRNSGRPDITVQMLDGPPWAPHPDSLDSINFDDFVRAAIVGYARGDGS